MRTHIQFIELLIAESRAKTGASKALRHPFFAWTGMRPPIAQHTRAEHEALMRFAAQARTIVEIGVAEGASAVALHESMPEEGILYLVDPFHLSRIPALNFEKRAARRAVNCSGKARAVWIEKFSQDAVQTWREPIDFLLIDGDHQESAVQRDWEDWSPFVKEDAVVAFHDARQFPGGWPTSDYGPVCFVNRMFRRDISPSWNIVEEVDSLVFVSRGGK